MVTVSFDYSQVSSYFVHCFNDACPLAATCLRQWVARRVTDRMEVVRALSPAVWPAGEGAECAHFKPMKAVRMAWGMRMALDVMPYRQARGVKSCLNGLYARTTLHRIMTGERPIPPVEQKRLEELFRQYGWEGETPFDRVEWRYDFD